MQLSKYFVVSSRVLLISVLLVSGCSHKNGTENSSKDASPISSLDETASSQKYYSSYWAMQEQENSKVWQQAMAVCKDRQVSEYPNCTYINDLLPRYSLQRLQNVIATMPAFNINS